MLLSVQSAPGASRCGPVAGGGDLDQDAGSECDTPIDIAAFVSAVRCVDPAGSQHSHSSDLALGPQPPLRDRRPREMSVSVTSRYWMVVFYFLMAFVLTFAEQFAEDRHAPASTEGVSATHSSEAGPSPNTEPNPVGGP